MVIRPLINSGLTTCVALFLPVAFSMLPKDILPKELLPLAWLLVVCPLHRLAFKR